MSVQAGSRILDSVCEDQEQSPQSTYPIASSLLPPIQGSTNSLNGRRKSFSRKNSFGISSIPALAAAQAHANAHSQQPHDTIQSIPETLTTLTPNVPTASIDRPASRIGAISLDAQQKEDHIIDTVEQTDDVLSKSVRKPYNVPESQRSRSFVRKDISLATVGSYNPYHDSWKEKGNSIAWSRSNISRFSELKADWALGPGSYNPTFEKVYPRNTLNMGTVAFKSGQRTFKVSNNPDIGPTTYSLTRDNHNGGYYIPWVKKVQSSLSRIINLKDPIKPTAHIHLIAHVADNAGKVKPKTTVFTIN